MIMMMMMMVGFGVPAVILAIYRTYRLIIRRQNQKKNHQRSYQNQKHKNQQRNLERVTRRTARSSLDFSSDSDIGVDYCGIDDNSRGRRRYKRVVSKTRTLERTYSHQPSIKQSNSIIDSGKQRGIMKTRHQASHEDNQRKHVTFKK